jgi:hypothetical protein
MMNNDNYCIYFYGDVLGYRELLKNNSIADLAGKLKTSIGDVESLVRGKQDRNEASRQRLSTEPEILQRFFSFATEGHFSSYFAFDTLLLFYKDISKATLQMRFQEFLLFSSSIYLLLLSKYNIKLRGVISLTNEYFVDEQLILVKNIDESFALEKLQEWSGILINIPDLHELDWGIGTAAEDEVLYYGVPTKNGTLEYPVLNPINKYTVGFLLEQSLSLLAVIQRLDRDSRTPNIDPIVAGKLRNTSEFLHYAKEHYEISLRWERVKCTPLSRQKMG